MPLASSCFLDILIRLFTFSFYGKYKYFLVHHAIDNSNVALAHAKDVISAFELFKIKSRMFTTRELIEQHTHGHAFL